MNLKNENDKISKNEQDKKLNINKFLNKNIPSSKEKVKESKKIDPMIINNNNNLIKFINASSTPNKSNNISNPNNNINIINNIKSPETKNKIELKLNPEIEIKNISINQNNLPSKNIINQEKNGALIKNISDNNFDIKDNHSRNNEQNDLQKYITSPKKENEDLDNNFSNNNYNNHKYLYINNSKEKNRTKINNENNEYIIYKNKKYKIGNIKNNFNNNINNEINKIKNDYNINKDDNNTSNKYFVNSFDERIEKIRETLNSINVIDILGEQAGLQTYKDEEFKDDDFYEKAKILNKEFYDNLDVKFSEIENILTGLEKK